MTHDFDSPSAAMSPSANAEKLALPALPRIALPTIAVATLCAVGLLLLGGCGGKDEQTADIGGYEAGEDPPADSSDSSDDGKSDRDRSSSNGTASGGTASSSGSRGDSTQNSTGGGDRSGTSTSPGTAASRTSNGNTGTAPAGGGGIPLQKPRSLDADSLDELNMPENGTPKEYGQYIRGLMSQPLRSKDPEKEFTERMQQAVEATQRILAHPEATTMERMEAAQSKFGLLDRLAGMGDKAAEEHMPVFAQGLAKDKDAELAQFGRLMTFQLKVTELINTGEGSYEEVANDIGVLAEEMEPSPLVFQSLVHGTIQALFKPGKLAEGRRALDSIVKVYAKNAQYEQPLKDFVEQARYFELNLENTLSEYLRGKLEVGDALRNDTLRLLAQPEPALQTLKSAAMIATAFERQAQYDSAKAIYDEIKRVYAEHENADIRRHVTTLSRAGEARLGMVGQPITINGKTLDGKPLDWAAYKGKVVCIVFWSVSDGLFLQSEMPKLLQMYEVYKDRGFEFLGINIDSNAADVQNFFNYQSMPWTTVVASMSEGNLGEQFGVLSLPYSVLLDAQGNVDSLHVSADNLPEKLVRMLGPPPEGVRRRGEDVQAPDAGDGTGGDAGGTTAPGPAPDPQQADDAKKAGDQAGGGGERPLELPPLDKINPYLARKGMSPPQLIEYILKMEDRPVGLRDRPGFKEAIIDAAGRVEASDANEKLKGIASEKKLQWLHAISMEDDAPEKIEAAVKAARPLLDHEREEVRQWAQFIVLEADTLDVDDLEIEKVPPLLERLDEYFAEARLGDEHLRLASATIHAVNRIDVEDREDYFQRFGEQFQRSSSRKLASYGKKLQGDSGSSAMEGLVGKPLEIKGQTGLGTPIDWASYRGRYVLVDFWATWCGPCMRAAPDIRALYDRHHEQGFDVVGVNLDRDAEALAKYLDKENPPWVNVVGDDAKGLAEELNIRGIPALLLIDKEGNVIAASHSVSDIASKLKKALAE